MKKIALLTLVFFSMMQTIFAQGSSVTFFSQNGERFFVILDGVRQNDKPGTNVKVTDLDRPNYRATIIFENAALNNINKNIFVQDLDGNMTNSVYNIRQDKKGNMDFRLSSFSEVSSAPAAKEENVVKYHAVENPLPAQPAPAVQQTTQVTAPVETTKTVTTTTTTTTAKPQTTKTTETVNINLGGFGIGTNVTTEFSGDDENVNINMNLGGFGTTNVNATTTTKQTVTTTTTTTAPAQTTTREVAPTPAAQPAAQPVAQGCVTAMTSADFSRAKTSVQNQSFSESRMKTAKQFTRANCLNVNQIREIMDLFSFDDDRLEYAKFAYDFCVDKRNYFQLSDGFKFSGSSDSLNDFLDSK